MKQRFLKELEHMYLVFDMEDIDENEYIVQMALRGRLPSLLPLSIAVTDGKTILRADVTGCTSIAARFQSVQLTGSDIRKILAAINDTIRKLQGYLLDPGDLYLDPDCIFLGPGSDEILLCYVPHLSEEDPDTIRSLAEFFLKKLNHSDRTAADLSYGLFDQVSSDHYILGEVLQKLLDSSRIPFQTTDPDNRQQPGKVPHQSSRPQPANRPKSGKSSLQGKGSWPAGTRKQGTHAGRRRGKLFNSMRSGRKEPILKKYLPVIIILSAAAAAAVLFRMDLTQIGGMGFLSAALIWLTYSAIGKRKGEPHSVWVDEDDPGDDAFYQALLKQVYAEDNISSETAPYRTAGREQTHSPGQNSGETNSRQGTWQEERSGPCLISMQPERCPDIMLSSSYVIIGKNGKKTDVVLPDDAISRVHARIERRTDGFYVSDLYSTNGTFLDGRRLESGRAVPLNSGSVLRMGTLQFRIRL